MRYLPHTEAEIAQMLEAIGTPSVDALFAPIPEADRLGRPLNLEPALDEATLMRHLTELAQKNSISISNRVHRLIAVKLRPTHHTDADPKAPWKRLVSFSHHTAHFYTLKHSAINLCF